MKRNTVKRWCIIGALLVGVAIGGRRYAQRTAAAILRPCFAGLVELGDVDGVLLVLRHFPKTVNEEYSRQFGSHEFKYMTTPLHEAVKIGDRHMVETLVRTGAKVDALDTLEGNTPMHWANDVGVVEVLLEAGANVNAANRYKVVPLHLATDRDNVEYVTKILAAGADVNAKTQDGGTPLHLVKSVDVAKLLLSAGAIVNVKNVFGLTPLDRCGGNPTRALLLRKHGAKTGKELDAERAAAKGGKQ